MVSCNKIFVSLNMQQLIPHTLLSSINDISMTALRYSLHTLLRLFSTSWPSLSPAISSLPPQTSHRRTHLTTTHHGHKQKAKGNDLEIFRCIGRESNPGLAELSEIRDLIWQRPILPLNHQCWRWKRLLWLVFVYAAPNWQHPHVR
jgi:hypothetical protein